MIALFACARALLALRFTGFGLDEAYTVAMSRDLALSYFDHPPLHQWITHFALMAFGAGPMVRLPFVVLATGTGWFLYSITRRVFGGVAGLWALFAFGICPYFLAPAGSWVSPDGPLLFCLAAAADAALAVLFPDPMPDTVEEQCAKAPVWWLWLRVGLWTGLAGLSKYLALFFPLGLVAFVALSPQHRHWLRHPAPWVAAGLAGLIVAPVLIWNAQHDWVSFAFQAGRAVPVARARLDRLTLMSLGQIAYLSPLIFPVLVAGVMRALARSTAGKAPRLLVWLAVPAIAVMTLTPVWGNSGFPHWTMPGWFFSFALFGGWMAQSQGFDRGKRVWAALAAGLTLSIALLFASVQTSDWLRRALPGVLGQNDPVAETLSWQPIRDAAAFQTGPDWTPAFVLAQNWIEGGRVDLAVGGNLPVLVFTQDPRGFAFRTNPAGLLGRDAVIVAQASAAQDMIDALRPYFAALDPAEPVSFGRSGRAEIDLRLIRAHRLLRPYGLPYGPWRLTGSAD